MLEGHFIYSHHSVILSILASKQISTFMILEEKMFSKLKSMLLVPMTQSELVV